MAPVLPVWVASLGCAKNRVDTEKLLGSLGVPVKLARTPGQSRLVFINTCAFIESATRESLRAIFDLGAQLSRLKRKPLVVVAGCLPGRYGIESLKAEIPEVDLWLDTKNQPFWPQAILNALKMPDPPVPGRLYAGKSYAFLKIAEGCPRQCAYCAIPGIKGPLVSESATSLLAESAKLVAEGAKELILVAQDTTAWGRDLNPQGGPRDLAGLAEALCSIDGLQWLRLLYLYPPLVTNNLLERLAQLGKPFVPYFDVPLQHSEFPMLRAMRRPAREKPLDMIKRIRSFFPKAAIRSTLMVGFPGETEAMFENMCMFVQEARLQHLGVFEYAREENTPAYDFPGQIAEDLKHLRRERLMSLQREISSAYLGQFRDEIIDVMIDEDCFDQWDNLYKGHTWFQCPEVDGVTYVSGSDISIGESYKCEVVASMDYDLSAII